MKFTANETNENVFSPGLYGLGCRVDDGLTYGNIKVKPWVSSLRLNVAMLCIAGSKYVTAGCDAVVDDVVAGNVYDGVGGYAKKEDGSEGSQAVKLLFWQAVSLFSHCFLSVSRRNLLAIVRLLPELAGFGSGRTIGRGRADLKFFDGIILFLSKNNVVD